MRALLAFTALVAIATPLQAGRDPVPEARVTGEARSCIPLRAIRNSNVHSDRVIDFEMNGGKVFRNELPYDCSSLGFEERFSYKTSLSQLCSTDIITVIQSPPGISGPSCGLGKFVPVELAKRRR